MRSPSSSASSPGRSTGRTSRSTPRTRRGRRSSTSTSTRSPTPRSERPPCRSLASYYDVQQALVALKGSPIATKHSPAQLKTYVYGDQIGTTSLAFITGGIQPTSQPKVFSTLNDVKQALQTHQIAAFVTDTPTAQYISSSEIPGSTMVAQFPSTGEHYGLLFTQGEPAGRLRQQGDRQAQGQRDAGCAAEAVPADLPDASRRSSRNRSRTCPAQQ